MKKLLLISLGILSCLDSFSAQALNFNASLLDDNLYTQNTLVPDAFSGNDSYQIAKTYFLPDYQAKIVSRASNSSNNDGDSDKNCSAYGFEACEAPKTLKPGAKPVHPIVGLDCYKSSDCICPSSYKYTSSNCYYSVRGIRVTAVSGSICDGKYTGCGGRYSTPYYTLNNGTRCNSRTSCSGCPENTIPDQSSNSILFYNTFDKNYQTNYCKCNGTNFPRTTPITNWATCNSCRDSNGKYSYNCTCKTNYKCSVAETASGGCSGICEYNCDAYPLTTCPTGGTCTLCPGNSAKKKLNSCNNSQGWEKSGNTCVAAACTTGYSAGVTSCKTEGFRLVTDGYSGGKVCGYCTCDNTCTTPRFNLTTKPTSASDTYSSCLNACANPVVRKYMCLGQRIFKNGACVLKTCTDYNSAYLSSIPSGQTCTPISPRTGLTCYKDCKSLVSYANCKEWLAANHPEAAYVDSDNALTIAGRDKSKTEFVIATNYLGEPINFSGYRREIILSSAHKYASASGGLCSANIPEVYIDQVHLYDNIIMDNLSLTTTEIGAHNNNTTLSVCSGCQLSVDSTISADGGELFIAGGKIILNGPDVNVSYNSQLTINNVQGNIYSINSEPQSGVDLRLGGNLIIDDSISIGGALSFSNTSGTNTVTMSGATISYPMDRGIDVSHQLYIGPNITVNNNGNLDISFCTGSYCSGGTLNGYKVAKDDPEAYAIAVYGTLNMLGNGINCSNASCIISLNGASRVLNLSSIKFSIGKFYYDGELKNTLQYISSQNGAQLTMGGTCKKAASNQMTPYYGTCTIGNSSNTIMTDKTFTNHSTIKCLANDGVGRMIESSSCTLFTGSC